MTFLQAMREANAWVPLAFYFKQKYDETPLKMKAHFRSSGSSCSDVQVAKLHVVEASWACLLRKQPVAAAQQEAGEEGMQDEEEDGLRRFMFLSGEIAPQCRIVDSGTAEGLAAVIESTLLAQDPRD